VQDSEIIERVLAGDHAAYATLVERHQPQILRLLERLVGCRDTAQDLAQEAFIAAFRGLKSFQQKSSFSTWLHRIACNKATSAARRRRPVPLAPTADPVAESSDVSARLEQADRQQAVKQALAQLDQRYRAVVVLADMEDATYESIAGILDIPVGTVRSRLHRARMELRERLRPFVAAQSSSS
jgi:RNA polymerase sigma-70 factor, ECF subfamily